MNRTATFLLTLLAAAAAGAHTPPAGKPLDAETEKLVRQSLPVCADMTLTTTEFPQSMPQGFSARMIHASSESHSCDGQYLLVTSTAGTYYLGTPWFLGEAGGEPVTEKLKKFTWTNMQANVTPFIEPKRSKEGLFPVTLHQMTERGKVPMRGVVDGDGRVFFLGSFQPLNADPARQRVAALQSLIATAPAQGASDPEVTVVEFSDFQCPSCKRSSGLGEELVASHGDELRYVRFDLPLIQSHPWAFGAAMAGRAIYRQKPELFWEYKKQVYENQDRLNAFIFGDFARAFAEDRGLDMTKYDADVVSEQVRDEILESVGAAFANHVRGTPTFMVNGVFVNAGPDGKELKAYVEKLLND